MESPLFCALSEWRFSWFRNWILWSISVPIYFIFVNNAKSQQLRQLRVGAKMQTGIQNKNVSKSLQKRQTKLQTLFNKCLCALEEGDTKRKYFVCKHLKSTGDLKITNHKSNKDHNQHKDYNYKISGNSSPWEPFVIVYNLSCFLADGRVLHDP